MMLGKGHLSGALVDTRPLPFHHSSVSHSVSLCLVSPFHLLHGIAIASFWSAPIPRVLLPVRLALCDFGAPGWGEPWFPLSVVLVPLLTEFV